MARTYLDKVYRTDPDKLTPLYDDWAGSYDDELTGADYATPRRLAALLARVAPDRSAPLMDFGCGTGLSGAELNREGFTTLDGCDLSAGMLEEARDKGIYRSLWQTRENAPLPFDLAAYPVVAAAGVISLGAAPPDLLDFVVARLAPGALFAFSFNDHTLADPDYAGTLQAHFDSGRLILRAKDYGRHLGDMNSTIYVVEKSE